MAVRIIDNDDYNNIRSKLELIMGTGIGQFGYGQSLVSSPVSEGENITKDQWDSLRWDILNSRIHQDGTTPTVVASVRGSTIRYGAGNPNTQYNSQADIATTNKFNVGAGQFVIDSGATETRLVTWNTAVSSTVTVTFSSADRARWFFNSGGKIRFSSSRTGGSATSQNTSWSQLLENMGSVEFGGNVPEINFYSLTTAPQTFFSTVPAFPYNANAFYINVSCNVSDNSEGGATSITFLVTWRDSYTDSNPSPPPDAVDGILSLTVDELRAEGTLLPTGFGNFTISRPSYVITPITGS